jgi:raffinose/stachyose/melibiose transport system permease protein
VTARFRQFSSWLWLAPAVVLVVVFVYYPVVDNIRLSFFSWNAFAPREKWVGLDNYANLLADPVFWIALANNLAYAVVSIIIQVGGGLVLAAILEEVVVGRWKGFFRVVFFIPATISLTVTGLLFQFLYNPQIGLIDQVLVALGHPELVHAWIGESATAIWGIIVMSQWQSTGYVMVLFIVAMQKIPRELYEAAYLDGASRRQAFFRITVPLVREMSILMLIVTISGAFLVFSEVQVMTAGGPNNSSHVLGTWLYKSAFFNDQMGYAAAIGTVIFVITFVTAALQLWYNRGKQVEI